MSEPDVMVFCQFCEVVGNIIGSNLVELCSRELVVGTFDAIKHGHQINNVALVVFDVFAGDGHFLFFFSFFAIACPLVVHVVDMLAKCWLNVQMLEILKKLCRFGTFCPTQT